jgi:hypothetical protein
LVEPPPDAMEDRDGVAVMNEVADGLDGLQAEHEHEQRCCQEPGCHPPAREELVGV